MFRGSWHLRLGVFPVSTGPVGIAGGPGDLATLLGVCGSWHCLTLLNPGSIEQSPSSDLRMSQVLFMIFQVRTPLNPQPLPVDRVAIAPRAYFAGLAIARVVGRSAGEP